MESPETNKPNTATTSSDSLAVQDSPIFSYISKLSPIKPVNAAPVAQGFPGLNSPPLVFTSPRINPHRKSCFLKRPQCPRSFTAELFRQEYRGNYIATATNESGKSTTQLSNGLNPCIEKGRGINGSAHDQAGSPSGCVEEYLADLLEVDWEDSTHSADLCLKQSDNDPQSLIGLMGSKESVSEPDNKDAKRKDVAMTVGASPASLEQTQENHQGTSNVKPVETDGKQGAGDMAISLCPKLESDVSVDHAFDEHSVSEFLPESMQIVEEYDEDCGETTGAVSSEPVENMMRHDCKAGQRQCVMRRRCLQFGDAEQKSTANGHGPLNPSNSASSPRSPASPADSVVLESSCVALPATPSSRQMANITQPTFSMFSSQNNGNSILTVSKPPGIGLHLNSIVNAMPVGCGATASMKSAEKGDLSVRGKKSVSITSCHISESHAIIVSSSAMSPSPNSMKSLNNPVFLKNPIEIQATPCDKGKPNSGHADGVEFNQSRKKRKKTSGTSDGDGCKRCNCKKTKCLKLYCDCFAAGIYCAEPCSCQGCFNRPDYEDTVLETRQQIESRNPLAFAPKIVQRVTGPPADSSAEDGNRLTPSSARHKRGCNCKKSMCLKKYCECYQANVGCSDGCRCEGCKNVYGRKGEYGMNEDIVSKEAINERLESSFDEKLEMVSSRNSLLHAELRNPHNLTPLTPSFQCSDRGKDKSTSWFPSRRYLPSPESNLTFLAPYGTSLGSPRNSDNHDMIVETNKEIPDVVAFDQELDYCNAERVEEFSPRCQGFGNIGPRTAMTNLPSMDMTSLTSPTTRDWTNGSRTQFFPGSGHFSSVNSLRWRSSPITPMTLFAGTKLRPVLDSYDGRCSIMGDDTPEILKDTPTPPNAVKVSSPNKKRVSPPYSRLHELGSSSSAVLKNGRKFILQAVPSFPPLTPCIDSKGSTSQNTNDPQDCGSSK